MKKNRAPCGGCPPGCDKCVFTKEPQLFRVHARTILTPDEYGCVHGGAIVQSRGTLGILRTDGFRPITVAGAAFLRETANPLAQYT